MAGSATSNGAWTGDNPIRFSVDLLIIQLILVLFLSRLVHFLLNKSKIFQPRVISEIIGGLLLGKSVLGHIPNFTEKIFPDHSLIVLTTVANIGLIFFLFMVGLELDIRSLSKTGSSALSIAASGITFPFVLGIATSFIVRRVLGVDSNFPAFVVFMGVAMSITAFPVLARILAERKLLTTDVGQIAMSAAAVNDVVAWILLALAVALASSSNFKVVLWILLSGCAYVVVMVVFVQRFMRYICSQAVDQHTAPEWIVAITLVGVLVSAFVTDVIGIHAIFGAFVFGLIIPKDGPFANLIIDKLEDVINIVFLPLYFASSGLNVRLQDINDSKSAGLVFLVIGTACVGKIGGTVIASKLNGVPTRKSFVLGILMNTKGLVELIVLNIGLQKKVINRELYTIMVIMALFTTFITTPLVMLIFEPARERVPHTKRKIDGESEDLRMVACVHGVHNLPGVLNLTELSRGSKKRPLKAFLLHLMEFSERSSAIRLVTSARKDGKPFWSKEREAEGGDQVVVAFKAFASLNRVVVQPMTAISAYFNMHEDIISTATEKRANMIVLPYHKHMSFDGTEIVSSGFATVNRRVLRHAPCSVSILIDKGFAQSTNIESEKISKRVAILFFGGGDDREALALGRRMAEHPGVHFTVFRLSPLIGSKPMTASSVSNGNEQSVPVEMICSEEDKSLDDDALQAVAAMSKQTRQAEGRPGNLEPNDVKQDEEETSSTQGGGLSRPSVVYRVIDAPDPVASIPEILGKAHFDLILVGSGQRLPMELTGPFTAAIPGTHKPDEALLIGPVAQYLLSLPEASQSSLLVVQQYDPNNVHNNFRFPSTTDP